MIPIPRRLQVFDLPIVLESKDRERLSVYLVGFQHLAPCISTINEPDLQRLVIMELMGKQRWELLDRLLMRIGKVQRKRIHNRITKCLRKHK